MDAPVADGEATEVDPFARADGELRVALLDRPRRVGHVMPAVRFAHDIEGPTVELRVLRVETEQGLVRVGRGDGVVGLRTTMRCRVSDGDVTHVW